jgi:hypothetical protein
MWTQIVGKVRLVQSPMLNHWWQVTLYVTPRGLTTSSIPHGTRSFAISFDFIDHVLLIQTDEGAERVLRLAPRSVADFYRELMAALRSLGMEVAIRARPDEVEDGIPFAEDDTHKSYDAEFANRHWRILVQADRVLGQFRSRFIGKCSPVHFFWGGFDMAVTRFSGRRAPPMPEADAVTREGYSHEVISHGFWAGSGTVAEPAFYSYTAPEPDGLRAAAIRPTSAYFDTDLKVFILRYDDMRKAGEPERELMDFLQSTYEAGAKLARWDRAALERAAGS